LEELSCKLLILKFIGVVFFHSDESNKPAEAVKIPDDFKGKAEGKLGHPDPMAEKASGSAVN